MVEATWAGEVADLERRIDLATTRLRELLAKKKSICGEIWLLEDELSELSLELSWAVDKIKLERIKEESKRRAFLSRLKEIQRTGRDRGLL